MSELGDFFEESSGGFAGEKGNDNNLAARFFNFAAFILIDAFEGIIAAFHVEVRLGVRKEIERSGLGKNANPTDAFQRSEHRGAISLAVDGTAGAFVLADSIIAVEPDEEGVAEVACAFEIGDVAGMEDVKTAVGNDEFLAAFTEGGAPSGKFFPGNNFVAKIHAGGYWGKDFRVGNF